LRFADGTELLVCNHVAEGDEDGFGFAESAPVNVIIGLVGSEPDDVILIAIGFSHADGERQNPFSPRPLAFVIYTIGEIAEAVYYSF
jgi:hypothetical protein